MGYFYLRRSQQVKKLQIYLLALALALLGAAMTSSPLHQFLQLAKPYCQHVPLAILGEPVNVPQGVGATRIGKYHHYAQVAVQGDDGGQLSGWAARASRAGWAGWADWAGWASWAELLSSRLILI